MNNLELINALKTVIDHCIETDQIASAKVLLDALAILRQLRKAP